MVEMTKRLSRGRAKLLASLSELLTSAGQSGLAVGEHIAILYPPEETWRSLSFFRVTAIGAKTLELFDIEEKRQAATELEEGTRRGYKFFAVPSSVAKTLEERASEKTLRSHQRRQEKKGRTKGRR